MKEVLICFVIALVVGSIINSTRQLDVWGTTAAGGAQASALVPAVTETTFQHEVLDSSQPVLVDFYTDECPHCTAMVPVVADLAAQLKGDVKIVRLDAGENAAIADKYGVHAWPAFVMFKGGEKIDETKGEQSKDELLSFIKKSASYKPSGSEGQEQLPHQANTEG